ncbi:hypothetical protein LCGC14_1318980, partial [marine sediment metagenome]
MVDSRFTNGGSAGAGVLLVGH